jgi:hypothetical protein
MIYNIKQNHTGNTDNILLGHGRQDNGLTYKVHSCKIANIDTTNVYVHIKLYRKWKDEADADQTETIELLKTLYIRKGYTIELFDEPFEYPDKYDLMISLDNSAYAISWITQTEVLDIESHIEC